MDLIFLCLGITFLSTTYSFIKKLLNRYHITDKYRDLPEVVREHVKDQDELNKINSYNVDWMNFGLIKSFYSMSINVAITCYILYPENIAIIQNYIGNDFWYQVEFIIIMQIIGEILDLPWGLYGQFVIEEKHGFNKMTLKLFFTDMIKSNLVSFAIMIPILWVCRWIFENYPDTWLIWATLFGEVFGIFMITIYPYIIEPLFNKVVPLEKGELRDELKEMIKRSRTGIKEIEVIDGSRRSSHSNAYTSGFLWFKRLVLYDTILKEETHDEIKATVAHELGHLKHKHVMKGYLISKAISLMEKVALYKFMNAQWVQEYCGLDPHTMLYISWIMLIFDILKEPIDIITGPLFAWYSRCNEYEADRYAVDMVGYGPLISGLKKIYSQNKSNLTPHPIIKMSYSHPLIEDRIAAIIDYAGKKKKTE